MATIRFILISLFLALVVASPASAAGKYRVYACKTPHDEVAPTDGWSVYDPASATAAGYNGCADGKSVGARVTGLTYISSGTTFGWGVDAPAGTRFTNVDAYLWAFRQPPVEGDTARTEAWVGFRSSAYNDAAWLACPVGSHPLCPGNGVATDAHHPYNHVSLDVPPGVGTRVSFLIGCLGSGLCRRMTSPDYMVEEAVQAVTFTLSDSSAPVVSGAMSGPLAGTDVHRGTESVSFPATDSGGGLYRTMVDIRPAGSSDWQTDRTIVDANGGHCAQLEDAADDDYEFGYLAPCKASATVSASLNTTKYADGDYELRVRVEDAAGNETVVVPQTAFTIHNAPVVAPGSVAVTGPPRLGTAVGVSPGMWTGDSVQFALTWLRCTDDVSVETCTAIPGATLNQYQLTSADLGRWLRVRVTGTNFAGSDSGVSPAVGPGVNAAGVVPECADGRDNDADGKIDEADPECASRAGVSETPPPPPPTPTPTPSATSTAAPAHASPTPTATVRPTATVTAPAGDGGGDGHHDVTPSSTTTAGRATLSILGAASRTLRYGRRSSVTVSLRDAAGQPIVGARLDVLERLSTTGAAFARQGEPITTDRDGTAAVPLRAAAGRTIRVTYTPSGGGAPDATADLQVLVRSRTTLHKSRSFLHNGQTLRFNGRVQSRPVPSRGVGIDLQAQVGKHWVTFKTLTTNAGGRWHSSYRFRSTSGLQTYRFRARVRGDSGFPYLPSTSKSITVKVKG